MRYGQKCKAGICRGSGKVGSKSQAWKMREWKNPEQIAGLENAGVGRTAIIQRDSLKLHAENCL